MVRRYPLTKARINLGAVVKDIHLNKGYVILEKDGIPIAAMMNVDEFEDYLETRDPTVKKHIAASTKEYLAGESFSAQHLLAEGAEKKGVRRGRKK